MRADRRVALKVLHSDVARDKVALERFKREYEISQLLPHEHIVEVYDFLKLADGTYALAMDFLDGEELRALLKREKTLRPARVVRMLSQIAIGLDEAHQRHLIHRDIKPDNVFLCGTNEGDVVKLLDFGSVKDKSEGAKKLTVMGTTIGSPFYMSPEQAQGLDTLDARADVWALAAISYESLTGKVPFTGNNGPSILLAILTQDPTPSSIVAKQRDVPYPVPPTVDDALDEAFAKEPSMRVGSVGLMADKLGHAYGLQGSHRDWAYTPEATLQESIDQALPQLMEKQRVAAAAEADPFARAEADPFAAPPRENPNAGATLPEAGLSTQELRAAVAPSGPPLALILGAVTVLFLLVGVAAVYFLFLR
ncbi:MAG: serine/threonine protein kinase, partial [Myxococcota bacterium]